MGGPFSLPKRVIVKLKQKPKMKLYWNGTKGDPKAAPDIS